MGEVSALYPGSPAVPGVTCSGLVAPELGGDVVTRVKDAAANTRLGKAAKGRAYSGYWDWAFCPTSGGPGGA